MIIPLQIETNDKSLAYAILGSNRVSIGDTVAVPGGVSIEIKGAVGGKSFDIPGVLQFILHTSAKLELALFTKWLCDMLDDKGVERITIKRHVVTEITAEGIRQVLEEEISSSR